MEGESIHSSATTVDLLRRAQRITHPDRGGEPATFQRVTLAEQTLRKAGLI
jgi:hypothetical protein